ncbi:MAG: hypothetical protein KJ887_03705 [Candidatus Omnitrophica bacterium]|nr:hypothetical protein [Candidatus Omnitrophota bacterium]MBU1047426.1 hypothetical protein [Candidatus Omnitrophota bacterium]MBU1630831.1 hypothetical protein [Candidatus Omnitrophota bacterium]MBU1767024.1 hypothetical protein [Candidatus Omnitrophota bacterium]
MVIALTSPEKASKKNAKPFSRTVVSKETLRSVSNHAVGQSVVKLNNARLIRRQLGAHYSKLTEWGQVLSAIKKSVFVKKKAALGFRYCDNLRFLFVMLK